MGSSPRKALSALHLPLIQTTAICVYIWLERSNAHEKPFQGHFPGPVKYRGAVTFPMALGIRTSNTV